MLAERGLDVSYETVRRWFLKFGSMVAANLRRKRPRPSDHWLLDAMAVTVQGKRCWLWRAVDNEGKILDGLFQRKRDAKAAKTLMRKLLKKQGFAPTRIVTDKLCSYPSAFRTIGLASEHIRGPDAPHSEAGSMTALPNLASDQKSLGRRGASIEDNAAPFADDRFVAYQVQCKVRRPLVNSWMRWPGKLGPYNLWISISYTTSSTFLRHAIFLSQHPIVS